MKKITSLLMLLCMFVGTAWAQGSEDYTLVRVAHDGWKVTAQNQYGGTSGNEGGLAFIEDENPNTFYHSDWGGTKDGNQGKQGFLVEMREEVSGISRITYAGRSDNNNNSGWAKSVRIYVYSALPEGFPADLSALSVDEKNTLFDNTTLLGTPVFENSAAPWAGDTSLKTADFNDATGKYILFIQDAGVDSWLTCSDFQVYKKVSNANVCKVQYDFYYNGVKKDKYSVEVDGVIGEDYPEITVSFPLGVFASKPEGKIAESDVVEKVVKKDINLTIELPFVVSESYENAVWQVIDMHSNENNYTWKFVEADADVELPVIAKTQTEALGDEFYWAFIGNPFDGYKIYNKAAGKDLTLRKAADGNTAAVMSTTNDRNVFVAWPSATNIKGAFCWKIEGDSYYINTQKPGSVKVLRGWTAADHGSSCRSFSPASFVLNAISLENYAKIPAGAIGSFKDSNVIKSAEGALNASKANEYDLTKLAELETAVKTVLASDTVEFVDGLYRIQNIQREQMVGFDGTDRVKGDIGKTDVSQIWHIKTVGDNIVLMNLNAGAYMQDPYAGNTLVAEAEAAKYKLSRLGFAQYNLKVEGNNLVIYDGGSLGGWFDNGLNSDGAWYIIPATDIEVEISAAGYSTTHLPFDVTLPNTVEAYAVTATSQDYATLTKKDDIPANTGAILKGEGTHTLTIAKANSDWDGNLLDGTNVPTNVEAAAYILAKQGENIGFYPVKFEVSTNTENDGEEGAEDDTFEAFKNKANKAYLPASAVPAGARFISFDFGGETSIDELKSENGNVKTVIYDLSGRRVQKAQKGIFIVNGKKVIK